MLEMKESMDEEKSKELEKWVFFFFFFFFRGCWSWDLVLEIKENEVKRNRRNWRNRSFDLEIKEAVD